MSRKRRRSGGSETSLADVFAGAMVASVLILVVMWLQAQADAYEVRKLRRMQRIFDQAFAALGESDEDIVVDKQKGEIRLRAETAFKAGDWTFAPDQPTRDAFVRTRHKLATVLARLEAGFARVDDDGQNLDARDHVEVLIVGHTDCKPFVRHFRRLDWHGDAKGQRMTLPDNWDLSVLRAAALARFFTRRCQDGSFLCCPDGTQSCPEAERSARIDPRWRILPAGRSQFEPRSPAPDGSPALDECGQLDQPGWLSDQRRVTIQIVPRMDKFVVRAGH